MNALFAPGIAATVSLPSRKLLNTSQITTICAVQMHAVWTANLRTTLVRYFHELTLSMSLGYAITWTELATRGPAARFSQVMDLVKSQFPPYEANNPAAAFPASLVVAAVLAASFFVLFRLVSMNHSSAAVLRWVGGAVALLAMPVTWFYVPYTLGRLEYYNAASVITLLVISVLAAVCAGRYLCGLWSVPAWGGVVLLVAYYTIWTWALAAEYDNRAFGLVRSMLAILSGIAWVLYARTSDPSCGAVAATS